jgi:hypothetical protein
MLRVHRKPTIKIHEVAMNSGQRKNSRTRTKSGTGRSKAKNKTRRSTRAKALAGTSEHVKKQAIKPHSTRRLRPAASKGSAGQELNEISNSTSSRVVTASAGKQTNTGPTLSMAFSPLAMLLRQQILLTSMMFNAMQTQQHWARAFSGLQWRTA